MSSRRLIGAFDNGLARLQRVAVAAEVNPAQRYLSTWLDVNSQSSSSKLQPCSAWQTQVRLNHLIVTPTNKTQLPCHSTRQTAMFGSAALALRRTASFQMLQHSGFATQTASSTHKVSVRIDGEFVVIELRLPGSTERRRFVLRRNVDRLQDLYAAVHAECAERACDVHVLTAKGERLAASTPLNVAFSAQNEPLRFVSSAAGQDEQLGEVSLLSDAGAHGSTIEHVEQLRAVVNSLYASLNIDGFRRTRRDALERELNELRTQIKPLETLRVELETKARRAGKRYVWFGMAYMGVQAGVLARLTWWEYSWDIVEPISYFVTYATSMVFFAYYLLTRQEWSFPAVEDRHIQFKLHSLAERKNFDPKRYNALKQRITQIEDQLRAIDVGNELDATHLLATQNANSNVASPSAADSTKK